MGTMTLQDLAIIQKAEDMNEQMYETFYITYYPPTKRYFFSVRTYAAVEVEWRAEFRLTLDQAREIVDRGICDWWIGVPEEAK